MQMIEHELEDMTGSELLDHVGELGLTQRRAEVAILKAAGQHAILNNPKTLDPEVSKLNGSQRAKQFGGHGTPHVTEFAASSFGARLGLSSYAGRELIGDALDLMLRLPVLWARVQRLEVKASYARYVAKKTRERNLSLEQAIYVDSRVAESADGRITWSRFEVLVEAAIKAADPIAAKEREAEAARQQFAKATRSDEHGNRGFFIRANFAVIARLDATVSWFADALKALGDESSLDDRRVKAILILANPPQAMALMKAFKEWKERPADAPMPADENAEEPAAPAGEKPEVDWSKLLPAVVLYIHLYGGKDNEGIARIEGLGSVTESWIGRHLGALANFKITPVLDLAGQAPVDAYEIPDRHRKAVHLMTPADIFPFATCTSRQMQVDHTVPYDPREPQGAGQSRVGNYGPMTTTHHRIKTHGGWKVEQPFPGIYVWRDPHGEFYLVDHTGTRRIPRTDNAKRPVSRLEAHFDQIILAA